jgi:hypothetical protein
VSAERLGRLLAGLLVFASIAIAWDYLLRVTDPQRPAGSAAAILFFGMVLVSGTIKLRRRRRWRRTADAARREAPPRREGRCETCP